MSLRFVLNLDTVAIDGTLSLRLSAADLQEALQGQLQDVLQSRGISPQQSRDSAHVDVPTLRSAADLSQAIMTSLFGAQP
jgi:hypothetical protein